MQNVLSTFQDELARIKAYVLVSEQTIQFGSTPISGAGTEVGSFQGNIRAAGLRVFRTSFDGALLILAASFEQFAIGMVTRFLEVLPVHILNYNELPESIRESNERATGDALSGRLPNYLQINRGDMVRNLFNCYQGLTPYVLNSQAIASSERNFTSPELAVFLRRIDVTQLWQQVSENAPMQSWVGANDAGGAFPKVQVKLNEFIIDRNNFVTNCQTGLTDG